MKAIICTAYGSPEVLRLGELPTPEPKRGRYVETRRKRGNVVIDVP